MKCFRLIAGIIFFLAVSAGHRTALAADYDKRIESGGIERRYSVHIPPGPKAGEPLALVIVLHGGGGSGRGAAKQTKFTEESDREGFALAYPDGTAKPRPVMQALGLSGLLTWNAGSCCGYAMEQKIDDVAFLRAMVARIEADFPIDRKRIYATGISNGGMMAYRLACEAGDMVAAVGVVAGAIIAPSCAAKEPVSVIHIHGAADENVPLQGGIGRKSISRTNFPPPGDSISFWVRADGCPSAPGSSEPAPGVRAEDYGPCRAGTEILYEIIEGGGHSWPGGNRMLLLLDPPSTAMDATATIWRFFAAHPKP